MAKSYHDTLEDLGGWIIARIWPHRYTDLEAAFMNFKNVLGILKTFNRHTETTRDPDWLETLTFYKTEWVEESEYDRRVRQYEDHVALVNDLFFELTRALNYICDLVRKNLLSTFRLRDGAVLVERGSVGFDLHTERLRPEYRNGERIAIPYPGIEEFKTVRYSRDFFVHPDEDEA